LIKVFKNIIGVVCHHQVVPSMSTILTYKTTGVKNALKNNMIKDLEAKIESAIQHNKYVPPSPGPALSLPTPPCEFAFEKASGILTQCRVLECEFVKHQILYYQSRPPFRLNIFEGVRCVICHLGKNKKYQRHKLVINDDDSITILA